MAVLLVICAAFVGLAAWVGGDESRGVTPPPGNAQQIASAQDMLSPLPGVAVEAMSATTVFVHVAIEATAD